MDPSSATINRGDSVSVNIRVDTDEAAGECINVIDGVISYSDSIVPVDISLGQSIFSVWVEEPTINEADNTITFAGGIPNGYCGRIAGDPRLTNTIATLIFRSPGLQVGGEDDRNSARIEFTDDSAVYLNDGRGTRASLQTFGTTITLNDTIGRGIDDEWLDAVAADEQAPNAFSIQLERDEIAFDGNYFITFSTSDKQTGISHYEVLEEPLTDLARFTWSGTDAPWIRTRSPYVLQDQTLNSTIFVRAIDKAGNEYVARLVPDSDLRTATPEKAAYYGIMIAVGAVLIALIVTGIVIVIRRRRTKVVTEESDDSVYEYEADE
ncbi:MAG: hypothetical protein AAGA35_00020 [Patescibacteria group bacterium]